MTMVKGLGFFCMAGGRLMRHDRQDFHLGP